MLLLNRRWPFRLLLAGALVGCAALAWGQGKSKEKITLQYRVARDAFAPSKFVAVTDGGISLPLQVSWDLPKQKTKDKKGAQEKQKKEFNNLIKELEANEINGVEFECRGKWLKKGFSLRITSVPQPTKAGKKTIKDNGR
jgi:hypothetical protein